MATPQDIYRFSSTYPRWVGDHTNVEWDGDVAEIVLPFLDRHNDYIGIFVSRREDGSLQMSDGGEIFEFGAKANEAIRWCLYRFGVALSDELHIETHATKETFHERLHAMIQAMIIASAMIGDQ